MKCPICGHDHLLEHLGEEEVCDNILTIENEVECPKCHSHFTHVMKYELPLPFEDRLTEPWGTKIREEVE